MITLKVVNHSFNHELNNVINIFKPYINDNIKYEIISSLDNNICKTEILSLDKVLYANKIDISTSNISKLNNIKKSLYKALSKLIDREMPWGYLNGIRPTKIVHNFKEKDYNDSEIDEILVEDYCISREKARLMVNVVKEEEKILKTNNDNKVSIYIGIPFCPSKCLYCSFTSYSIDKYKDKIDDYLKALMKEIKYIAEATKDKKVESLYIGGGTPTSLNERQLELLLSYIDTSFNLEEIDEYTVEAGRPDTINREKLRLMKKHGVARISINPQTMNQKTLDVIGRDHSVEDIINTFEIAREEGHNNINMDLIMGLPGESKEEVVYTMKELTKLNPENITVHTMAVKRTSRLKKHITDNSLLVNDEIEQMLGSADKYIRNMNMIPYYMYRQKDTVGTLENIGYAKPGTESIYNVQMIAEQQTIIAAGSGAVTKIVSNKGKKIKRVANVRDIDHYINRIDEMIDRKRLANI